MAVYRAVYRVLDAISRFGEAPPEVHNAFVQATDPTMVEMLFEDEARQYLDEIRRKEHDVAITSALAASLSEGEQKAALTMKHAELMLWMEQQRSGLKTRFTKYLALGPNEAGGR